MTLTTPKLVLIGTFLGAFLALSFGRLIPTDVVILCTSTMLGYLGGLFTPAPATSGNGEPRGPAVPATKGSGGLAAALGGILITLVAACTPGEIQAAKGVAKFLGEECATLGDGGGEACGAIERGAPSVELGLALIANTSTAPQATSSTPRNACSAGRVPPG